MMVPEILATIAIDASRDRVWTVLTTPELVGEWLGCIGFEPSLGHLFYMQPDPAKRAVGDIAGATHCEIEEMVALECLRFSWFVPGTPKTQVTIKLKDTAVGASIVELCHDGWDQFDGDQIRGLRDMLAGGWTSHVLPALKRAAEAGPEPAVATVDASQAGTGD